jgi:preprotein translocase subunit SecF
MKFIVLSAVLVGGSLLSLYYPGPNFGIDFKGGTEIEVQLEGKVTAAELRSSVAELGFGHPEVIAVEGHANRFILRLTEVSSLPDSQVDKIRAKLAKDLGDLAIDDFKVSPGGDKLTLRLSGEAELERIRAALEHSGVEVRSVTPFGKKSDFRYEALLLGVGDEVVTGLKKKLGDRAPAEPLRVEWVGPKAGAQLRDAAVKSLLYAIAFIMVYVAFRFDLRFAPGGVLALAHDAIITVGFFVLLQKEITLATIAAILTVIGYSINDTIVVYDRIRENMQRMRDVSLYQVINTSTNQTMSRTIVTTGTTGLAVSGFLVWGTPVIQDIVSALLIGFLVGTYSSIYIASALTEWLDRRFFRKA